MTDLIPRRIAPAPIDVTAMAANALVTGTEVLTLEGALPVEYLTPGDRIVTRDAGAVRLRDLHHRSRMEDLVVLDPGSLGKTRPDRPTYMCAGQQVLLRDWRAQAFSGKARVLVPAARLVDDIGIRACGRRRTDTFALLFDSPHILYADGLELASGVPVPQSA